MRGISPGDGDPRHGSVNGYGNLGCRCDECCKANTDYMRDYRRRRGVLTIKEDMLRRKAIADTKHGTESRYRRGCRCASCTYAASVARASRRLKD